MKSKVAIYVRVSTLEQAESGYSVDEQIDKLVKYCEIKDWQVYDTYVDPGYSGSNIKRPALQRLINDVERNRFDTVLIYKLDRISRSQRDTLYLIEEVFNKNLISFVSLSENFDTSTPFGKAMIGILSVFAQLEREQITERMQMGKVGRVKSGKAMGWVRPPFGYSYKDDSYHIVPLEAFVVKNTFESYLSGTSITKLRDKLNDEGHIGKDKKWSYRTLRQMLDNPVYAGYQRYKGSIYPANHEPIVDNETFDLVQKELRKRQVTAAENFNPRPFQAKYMLSGTVKCGYCGAPLESQIGYRKNGEKTYRYQCKNRFSAKQGATIYNDAKKCHSGFYYMGDLENYVIEQIQHFKINYDAADDQDKEIESSDIYKERIKKLEEKLKKLSDLYLNDVLTISEVQDKTKVIKKDIDNLLEKVLEIENNDENVNKFRIKKYFENIDLNNSTYEEKKIIVNTIIEKVSVTADTTTIKWRY